MKSCLLLSLWNIYNGLNIQIEYKIMYIVISVLSLSFEFFSGAHWDGFLSTHYFDTWIEKFNSTANLKVWYTC